MATHSSILVWRIPETEEPGGLRSKESDMTEATEHTHHAGKGQVWLVWLYRTTAGQEHS